MKEQAAVLAVCCASMFCGFWFFLLLPERVAVLDCGTPWRSIHFFFSLRSIISTKGARETVDAVSNLFSWAGLNYMP